MKNKSHTIAFLAVMFTCIFVAMMLDKGISSALPISTAFCSLLITFSFCFLTNNYLVGFLSGVFFGLASCLKELFFPSLITTNLVSIGKWYIIPVQYLVPRLAVGIFAFAVYKVVLFLMRNAKSIYLRQTVSISIASFFGLLANTILFLSILVFSNAQANTPTTLVAVLQSVVIVNILPEYLITILLAPHVVLNVRKAMRWGLECNLSREDF